MFKLYYIVNASYYLYKCINNNIKTEKEINNMLYYIDNSGCFFIKVVQSFIPRIEYTTNINKNVKDKIMKYYENCSFHDISYTKHIYKKEHLSELYDDYEILDIIGSGSIAQVYRVKCKKTSNIFVLKITHPNLILDFYSFYLFYKILSYAFNLHKIIPIYNMDNSIKQLYDQTNLIHEVNNMCKLSSCTSEKLYIIPKVVKFSKNIIVMTYHKKSNYENLTYIKKRTIWLKLLLFTLGTGDYIGLSHCDLHSGNYSYLKEKIIIYDMGFCATFVKSEFDLIFSLLLNNDKKKSIYAFIEFFNNKSYNKKNKINDLTEIHDFFENANDKEEIVNTVKSVIKYIIKKNILIPTSIYNLLLVGNYFESNAGNVGIGNCHKSIHDKLTIGLNDITNSYDIYKNVNDKIKPYLDKIKHEDFNKSNINFKKLKTKII
mgnify:CR=1 FL=1